MPENRVEIDVQVKGNVPKAIREKTEALKQWIDSTAQLAQRLKEAEKPAASFPSVMARMTLEAQRMKVGYAGVIETMGDTTALQRALVKMESFVEDAGFTMGKVWEGVNKQFRATFTDQATFALRTGEEAFKSLHKTLDDGLTNVLVATFSKSTDNVKKTWEKFVESLEAAFYQSLGRMASALVQENLLAPLFKLGQGAVGSLIEGVKALFLGKGGLVTKPTLAVIGEAGPEVFSPAA